MVVSSSTSLAPTITAEDLARIGSTMAPWRIALARFMLTANLRGDFYDKFGVLLEAGKSEADCLARIWMTATRNGKWTALLSTIFKPLTVAVPVWLHSMLGQGQSFDSTMRAWIPGDEGQVLSAYIMRGLTPAAMYDLAIQARTQAEWVSLARSAAWPYLSNIAMIGFMTYSAAIDFFPPMLGSIPSRQLSGQALLAKNISDLLLNYGGIVLLVASLIPFLVIWSLPRMTGKVRVIFDQTVWPYTTYRKFTGTKWLYSISALLDAGNDPHRAVESMIEESTKPYINERLHAIIRQPDKYLGHSLASTGLEWPDSDTIDFITIAEESSHPGPILKSLADRQILVMTRQMRQSAKRAELIGLAMTGLFLLWSTSVMSSINTMSIH